MMFARSDRLMRDAVQSGVFPGGVLLVFDHQGIRFHQAYGKADIFRNTPMDLDMVFDLASLTKPLATTLAVAVLVKNGLIGWDDRIGNFLPVFEKRDEGNVCIRDLLAHCAGFAAYRPYYLRTDPLGSKAHLDVLRSLLVEERLQYLPRQEYRYSDVGFMMLHWVIETVSGQKLDRFVQQNVYNLIEGVGLFFNTHESSSHGIRYASTEWCPWRSRLMCGQVHDENAWAFGGVGGHAGLFGRAVDIWLLIRQLLSDLDDESNVPIFPEAIVRELFAPHRFSPRALGFDLPSTTGSSSGRWFSPESIGHLGFTGTSFWVDLKRRVGVILLTNRVHPSRRNIAIRAFRPLLHDAVMETFGYGHSISMNC